YLLINLKLHSLYQDQVQKLLHHITILWDYSPVLSLSLLVVFVLHLIARDKTFLYLISQLNRLILALFLFVLLLELMRFPMERIYFRPLFVTKEDLNVGKSYRYLVLPLSMIFLLNGSFPYRQ